MGQAGDYSTDLVAIGYSRWATLERSDQTETACAATAGSDRGKPTRPMP